MNKYLKWFVLVGICLAGPGTAHGEEVSMAFGLSLQPYVIPKTNNGIEVDVVREALKFRKHHLMPEYVPLESVPKFFVRGRVAAAQRDGGQDLSVKGGFYAEECVGYQDVMVTLLEKEIRIAKPEDLQGLKVAAFPGAADQYPDWLGSLSREQGRYAEQSKVVLMVKTLHKGHFDVIVGDIRVIDYHTAQVRREGEIPILPTTVHYFTGPVAYRPVFKDPQIRDDFNAGLIFLRETGKYQEILDAYTR